MISNHYSRSFEQRPFYLTPCRSYHFLDLSGAVVCDYHFLDLILELVGQHCDYLFLDGEMKSHYGLFHANPDLLYQKIKNYCSDTPLLIYKGNDITASSCLNFLDSYFQYPFWCHQKKIALIGAGNLASKVALKLLERGAHVHLYRRNQEKLKNLCEALNSISSSYIAGRVWAAPTIESAVEQADVVIGMTHGTPVIHPGLLNIIKPETLIVDGGKGNIDPEFLRLACEKQKIIYRLDIGYALEVELFNLVKNYHGRQYMPERKKFDGFSVVSSGVLADKNEWVVDSFHNPKSIYGQADGLGQFLLGGEDAPKHLLKIIDDKNSKNLDNI
jgi:hypothetical protein